MATITEDYVSFETAKLLKEKEFDIPCNCYGAYNGINLIYRYCITDKYTNWNKHADERIISCPTLQMTMKWLREVHNIFIQVELYSKYNDYWFELFQNTHRLMIEKREIYNSYEEAVEAGIKYCLENLIK